MPEILRGGKFIREGIDIVRNFSHCYAFEIRFSCLVCMDVKKNTIKVLTLFI